MPVMGVDVGKTTATIVLACAAFATGTRSSILLFVLPKFEPALHPCASSVRFIRAGMWAMYHQHGQFAMLLLSMLLTSLIVCVHTDWFEEWLED